MRNAQKYWLVISLALCACTHQPSSKNSSPTVERSAASLKAGNLLAYAREFGELPANAQKNELSTLISSAQKNKSDFASRIKIAMIYALPTSRLRDDNKALLTLDELQKDIDLHKQNSLQSDDIGLIKLLRDFAQDHQKNLQKLNEEQKRSEALSLKYDALMQKYELLQNQTKALEQKLEALKSIEKNMLDRDQGTR